MFKLLPFFIIVALSGFAHWLDLINVLTYVGYEMNASALQVAMVAIAMLLPHALFGRLYARFALQFSFRHVFAFSLTGRAATSFLLLIAPDVYAIMGILFVRSMLIGFMQPALSAYVSQLQSTVNIAGIINMILTSSKIIAPAIGGVFSITAGEHFAFVTSGVVAALAVSFVLWIPNLHHDEQSLAPTQKNPFAITRTVILFSIPILFIEGMSLLFTNVIPYSFNYYSVPKITLSIALSVSAVGNLLTGAYLVSKGSPAEAFPFKAIFIAWLTNCTMFFMLTMAIGFAVNPMMLIVVAFFFLAVSKTLFDVSTNSYIFAQAKAPAAQLSALRQTLTAIAGITLTLLGAIAIEATEPVIILTATLCLSSVVAITWLLSCLRMQWQTVTL
jgi:MFS family permease